MDHTADTGGILIRIEASPGLAQRASIEGAAVPAIASAVAEMLKTLGIPGEPEVSWQQLDSIPARPLAIRLNGRLCRYSDELMLAAYSYLQSRVAMPFEELEKLPAWLATADQNLVVEWLTLVCVQALAPHAGAFLGPDQARAYNTALGSANTAMDNHRLASILARVLDLGISIADQAAVASVLNGNDQNDDAICEALISKLSPGRVEVRVEPGYLRWLTTSEGARGSTLFGLLRSGMFAELGVIYPPFQVISDETLRPGSFVFRLNHLKSVPSIGLTKDQILVNAVPERVPATGLVAEPALNPSSYQPNAVASASLRKPCEDAGITCWDAFEFVILSLAAELRPRGYELITCQLVERMLEVLGKDFPELQAATDARLPLDQVTQVVRGLASEPTSVRNFRRILELLLECEFFVHSAAPLDEKLKYVRQGLADAIAHQCRKGGTALVTYVLDFGILQNIAAAQHSLNEEFAQKLIDAVRNELNRLSSRSNVPLVLVDEEVRAPLQAIVTHEFPRLRVVSYSQLPPGVNIQPIARVELVKETR